jgi:hypothetical protein
LGGAGGQAQEHYPDKQQRKELFHLIKSSLFIYGINIHFIYSTGKEKCKQKER